MSKNDELCIKNEKMRNCVFKMMDFAELYARNATLEQQMEEMVRK